MAWILLEGLDRSGKSSVAEIYKKQGYEVVHMDAPNKKFQQTGYAGPSYLEEIVEMYNLYAGKDVVFDRTVYGELVWPEVFMRMPLLNNEDLEYLSQLEYNQDATKYLMVPEDTEAHWKRCVDNKEPINRIQFVQAARLYDKLELERGFERKQLSDFSELAEESDKLESQKDSGKEKLQKDEKNTDGDGSDTSSVGTSKKSSIVNKTIKNGNISSMAERLERANAIRAILGSKILKKKNSVYSNLEEDIRGFLEDQLGQLFEVKTEKTFTEDEIQILKIYAQRIKAKME